MLSANFLADSLTFKSADCIYVSGKTNNWSFLGLLCKLLKILGEKKKIPLFLWSLDALWVSSLSHFSLPQKQANKLVSVVVMVSWYNGLMIQTGQCLARIVMSYVRPADMLCSSKQKTSWEAYKAFIVWNKSSKPR